MSFSSDVKEELARLVPDMPCCAAAQAYGLLEFGRSFSASSVSLHTENTAVAACYRRMTTQVCGLEEGAVSLSVRPSGICILDIPSAWVRLQVIQRFGHSATDIANRINRANFECESCPSAFLRGVFLSCGTITDPHTGYHLEFSVPFYRLSRDLPALMGEMNLPAKLTERKGIQIVYLRESGRIEDCLTLMGATSASLELMGIKMVKDIRNIANRIANCEGANIGKTVTAAMEQTAAIRKIESNQGLDSLPEELKELAILRLDNPDLSLRELGERLNPPLSRSGVNHRLRRLMRLAEEQNG